MTERSSTSKSAPLVETLAECLFYAEMGHTGMTWDQLSAEFGQEEYRRKVSRMCEGLWRTGRPFILLDLDDDSPTWLEHWTDAEKRIPQEGPS